MTLIFPLFSITFTVIENQYNNILENIPALHKMDKVETDLRGQVNFF